MALKIPRSRLRSIYKSPYLVYPAGILAIVLIYTLVFLLLQDNFHLPDGRSDFLTALYWVVITMTTTGYGDIYPVTAAGQDVLAAGRPHRPDDPVCRRPPADGHPDHGPPDAPAAQPRARTGSAATWSSPATTPSWKR